MFSFVLRRLALVLPTFLGITLLVFSLIRLLPGDPVEAISRGGCKDPARSQTQLHLDGHDRRVT